MESLTLHHLVLAALVALLFAAALSDGLRFLIPNRAVLAIALLYPVHVATSPVAVDWPGALAVAAIAFAAGAAMFARGWLGGGDVKLFAAVALWAGPAHIVTLLFATTVVGGAMALLALGAGRLVLIYAFTRLGVGHARDMLMDGQIPYGAAIAAGGTFVALRFLAT
ncbi:MAG: prepilin peptidase [Acetobacterales bacterium]